MRTDWHRYNLKRRVASLPPISSEIFTEKVLHAQANSSAVAAKASFEKTCPACQKLYYSQNAYDNHLKSQRHRSRVAALNTDGGSTVADAENGSLISSTISLGDPINTPKLSVTPKHNRTQLHASIDDDAKAEFTKVISGIMDTTTSNEPLPRRPTRPHHSAEENRIEHPLSPEKGQKDEDASKQSSSSSNEEVQSCCLFCHLSSPDLETNVDHMIKSHGLFIPERKYLVDLEGLFLWLWRRVNEEPFECLYCHKTKNTAEAVQDHMRDSGHCKIAFEEEIDMIEVGQFYDFRSTYSDEDLSADDDMGDGWEDDSDAVSDDIEDTIEVDESVRPQNRPSQLKGPSQDRAIIVEDELYLPSGKVAGHRNLAKFFRQNLHRYPTREEILQQQKLVGSVEADGQSSNEAGDANEHVHTDRNERGRQFLSRSNGSLGMLGVTDAKRREIQTQEKRDTKRAQRAEKQYQWGLNKRANQQAHFRDPLLQ